MENGLKVGVIGFTTDFITRWERPENIENIDIIDTFDSIKKHYDTVKEQCDVIVGVYHGGFEFDFDILLTGHQHLPIANMNLHGTHIAQTPHNGSKFLELKFTIDDNGLMKITSSLENIELNPNKEMYDKFLPLENKVQQWLDTPVGVLDTELQPTTHLDMALSGANLANFINQIQHESTNADISCTAFANVIKGFGKNVTVRDILSTYPYPNTLVVLEVNREILKLALERAASYFENNNGNVTISERFLKPKVEHYNYDYFSNINYTFDLT